MELAPQSNSQTTRLEVVLYQPEIPPNTGNIARLCAATQTPLHLIKPLGFSLDDRQLKRAGLDYWPHVEVTVWDFFEDYLDAMPHARRIFTSARRGTPIFSLPFRPGDHLVFGPETRGCPSEYMDRHPDCIARIPIWGHVRSLNLSTAAGIVLYEALRQTRFHGCTMSEGAYFS
jgi:tRNA (cytidine/uridine-2'-O-)-methyltransferase